MDHRAYAMSRKLSPIVQRFGGFKASNHDRKRGRISAGHSRARCGSCVLCALDRLGLLDNWDRAEARGELSRRCAFCYHLTRSSGTRADHPTRACARGPQVPRVLRPTLSLWLGPSLGLFSVSSHRNLSYRFAARKGENWCPRRRHPLHAYRYYKHHDARRRVLGTPSLVSFWSSSR
jgi:hypothetical protein